MWAANTAKTPRGKTPRKRKLAVPSDPVEVYCRIRPLEEAEEDVCLKALSDTQIQMAPSENSNANRNGQIKESQYAFQFVFDETAPQKRVFDHVALPLVDDLIKGKNGLLFTYGITSSGKTYTMSGQPLDQGIVPRCFDVIFNSVTNKQAPKYVFKPDKDNWFDIQSDADAMMERQKRDILPGITTPKTPARNRGDMPEHVERGRCPDQTTIEDMEEDNVFGVFMSFVEIYNNNIYDLLEELPYNPIVGYKAPTSKTLREDTNKNMYVHQVMEVEVTSPDEAFNVIYKGQKRRRVAHTALNAESSRSHSVCNIRVVQAPLDPMGKDILRDPTKICVSQLSLVDLAGSERCKRTHNTGDRLKEAGNINQDLMTLRTCIETLRENQKTQSNRMVCFRNTRLTHLFRNFFEDEGKVRMIVCVNPRSDDYDETCQVMKFAELTQEIMIARPQAVKFDVGLTPGRRRIYKAQIDQMSDDMETDLPSLNYSLGPPFPTLLIMDPSNDTVISSLVVYLEERMKTRSTLLTDLAVKQEEFRSMLVDFEAEMARLRERNRELEAANRTLESSELKGRRRVQELQKRAEELGQELQWKTMEVKELDNKLDNKDIQIEKDRITRGQMKANFNTKLQHTRDLCVRNLDEERRKMTMELNEQDQKLKNVETILNKRPLVPPMDETPRKGHVSAMKRSYATPRITPAKSDSDVSQAGMSTRGRVATRSTTVSTLKPSMQQQQRVMRQRPGPPLKPKPAYNPRHRRSKSTDTWIDHRPPGSIDMDGLLQPLMRKKRSVTRLSARDTREGSKYCLTHQEQDTDGEIETRFIKGDMIPTAGGGTAVVFNDVEVVRQESPGDRKRKVLCPRPEDFDGEWTDTEERCKLAMEHHGQLKRIKPSEV